MSIEKKYSVYIHTTPSNKKYIGITKQKCINRWKNGLGYCTQKLFKRAIDKYGWNNIKHDVLFENLTKDEAIKKEIELIKLYKSNDIKYGYNLTNGGEGFSGMHLSEETKKKISNAMKGKTPYNKGKKMNKAQYERLIETRKRKKVRCINTNETFDSLKEASNYFNFDMRYISGVCRGVKKTTHGYSFEFVGGEL